MKKMNVVDWIAMVLLIIGGLNWGLLQFGWLVFGTSFRDYWDLVAIADAALGDLDIVQLAAHLLVGVAAIYVIVRLIMKAKKK